MPASRIRPTPLASWWTTQTLIAGRQRAPGPGQYVADTGLGQLPFFRLQLTWADGLQDLSRSTSLSGAYARPVARVDPEDDDVLRFVVQHYRYDPERHERRHVVVAAFDNEQELLTGMDTVRAEIEGRKSRGELVDPREHASGAVLEPGYRRRAANGHLVMRAMRRGVRPGPWLDELELPSNVSVERAEGPSA
jgi:hypothetical protein